MSETDTEKGFICVDCGGLFAKIKAIVVNEQDHCQRCAAEALKKQASAANFVALKRIENLSELPHEKALTGVLSVGIVVKVGTYMSTHMSKDDGVILIQELLKETGIPVDPDARHVLQVSMLASHTPQGLLSTKYHTFCIQVEVKQWVERKLYTHRGPLSVKELVTVWDHLGISEPAVPSDIRSIILKLLRSGMQNFLDAMNKGLVFTNELAQRVEACARSSDK